MLTAGSRVTEAGVYRRKRRVWAVDSGAAFISLRILRYWSFRSNFGSISSLPLGSMTSVSPVHLTFHQRPIFPEQKNEIFSWNFNERKARVSTCLLTYVGEYPEINRYDLSCGGYRWLSLSDLDGLECELMTMVVSFCNGHMIRVNVPTFACFYWEDLADGICIRLWDQRSANSSLLGDR